jgi:hypothetical protein
MQNSYNLFFSHSGDDKELANELCNYLESNGLSCWIAPRDVSAGKDYSSEIVTAIENSGLFLLLLTENANDSKHVTNEVDRAFNKRKTIIPLRLGDFVLNKSLEFYLSKSHWIDAGDRPEKSFGQLLTQIQRSLGFEAEKDEKSATKAVLQAISPQQLTVVINEEVIEIPNSPDHLRELLEKHETYFFSYNKQVYNSKNISEGAFNLLTGKAALNQHLVKTLIGVIKTLCPAAGRFSEKVAHIENWEADPRISDKAKEIIAYSFAGIVGKEISKLMAIGKEPFSETRHHKYVEKCVHIVKHTLDLIIFSHLSKLWDLAQEDAINFSDAEKKLLTQRFDAPFEPTIPEQSELLLALIRVCSGMQDRMILPLPELTVLMDQPEMANEFMKVCKRFEQLQGDIHDIQDCFEAEQNLAIFLGFFGFLSQYRMASVKVIGYRQIKNYRPGFVHRYIALGIDNKANVDAEKVEYNQDATYSDSVLIFKGDNFKESINLFPFVVDYNAINFEQGSNICFYRSLPLDDKRLEYFSLETGKPVIFEKTGVLEQKKDLSELLGDAENSKLLNKECVYDRFMEARRCILNEISFDDI